MPRIDQVYPAYASTARPILLREAGKETVRLRCLYAGGPSPNSNQSTRSSSRQAQKGWSNSLRIANGVRVANTITHHHFTRKVAGQLTDVSFQIPFKTVWLFNASKHETEGGHCASNLCGTERLHTYSIERTSGKAFIPLPSRLSWTGSSRWFKP